MKNNAKFKEIGMKKYTIHYLLIIVSIFLLTCSAIAWESVGSPINVNIPPHKAFSREFDLISRGRISIDFTVHSGQMDIYLMTQEQDIRASSGIEPTKIGRDFITKNSGVLGKGGTYSPVLDPGRYAVIFRNVGDTYIQVTASIEAEPR
jgi:hypothetical protein